MAPRLTFAAAMFFVALVVWGVNTTMGRRCLEDGVATVRAMTHAEPSQAIAAPR